MMASARKIFRVVCAVAYGGMGVWGLTLFSAPLLLAASTIVALTGGVALVYVLVRPLPPFAGSFEEGVAEIIGEGIFAGLVGLAACALVAGIVSLI